MEETKWKYNSRRQRGTKSNWCIFNEGTRYESKGIIKYIWDDPLLRSVAWCWNMESQVGWSGESLMDFLRQLRHVCPSVRMEQLGSHWTDFYEIWYLNIFRKSAEKIQVSLKSDKSNGYFTWRPIYMFDYIPLRFFFKWEMFQRKVVEKIKAHILF